MKLLIADPNSRARLATVTALREHFSVVPIDPGEDPVRAARRVRPQLVLLAVPAGRAGHAQRACRIIKTDSGEPPPVGLLDPGCRLARPETLAESCLCDGYLGGRRSDEELLQFVRDLAAGKRPLNKGPMGSGLVGSVLRALRSS